GNRETQALAEGASHGESPAERRAHADTHAGCISQNPAPQLPPSSRLRELHGARCDVLEGPGHTSAVGYRWRYSACPTPAGTSALKNLRSNSNPARGAIHGLPRTSKDIQDVR